MDFELLRARLLEKHTAQSRRLTPLLRRTAHDHYVMGIQDTIRALQEQAIAEEAKAGGAVMPSAPLAVQPAHSAVEEG